MNSRNETPDSIFWLQAAPEHPSQSSNSAGMFLRFVGSGSAAVVMTKDPPKFLRSHLSGIGQVMFTSWKHPGRLWSLHVDPEKGAKDGHQWSAVEIREDETGKQGFSFSLDHGNCLTNPDGVAWAVGHGVDGHLQLFHSTEERGTRPDLPQSWERITLCRQAVEGQEEAAQ